MSDTRPSLPSTWAAVTAQTSVLWALPTFLITLHASRIRATVTSVNSDFCFLWYQLP